MPGSKTPTVDDLLRIAHRFDAEAQSAARFGVASTAAIGGSTRVEEPRPFGLLLGDAGLDDSDLRTVERLIGFTPRNAVGAFAYMNAPVDHRLLGELALFLARELDGLVDFGGTLGPIAASPGTLLAIPYEASTLDETFHVSDAKFLEWWLEQRDFHMVK